MEIETEDKAELIADYISGLPIKATPEEVDAVQVFSKQLVEDYGYPKELVQTHPQYRVKVRPSDTKKEYPVDIAVFTSREKKEDELAIVIECKKKNRKDGLSQLKDYLRFSRATSGVWFNGEERLFIRKFESKGRVDFEEIPNIPRYGQRLEDIGKFKREDLKSTHNLKAIFKSIRNFWAANNVGATRDEVLAQQLINLIFCKIYDEKFTRMTDIVRFRAGLGESPDEVKVRIDALFDEVKKSYKEIIDFNDEITIDNNSLVYVVGELQNYSLLDTERDVIGDAFEVFIGHALKGGLGQFFTPRNVIQMLVTMVNPTEQDKIIDPACGSGGFLIDALRHVWGLVDEKGVQYGWNNLDIEKEKQRIAIDNFRGIDKDYFLSKVTKAYMAIVGDGKGGIFCQDSLDKPATWRNDARAKVKFNEFDVVLTNPPFGSKIPVQGEEKLKQFNLGHKWKQDKKKKCWEKKGLKDSEAPQILFIERCLELLKDGGRLGIVLPDGILGNNSLGYIRQWISEHAQIIAVIDVPVETFMPNTSTKTSILILQKTKSPKTDYPIFMAVAETCGHDRRGKETDQDDIKSIPEYFSQWKLKNKVDF